MATLTVATAVDTGLVLTGVAVAASDKFPNDGKTLIAVYNSGAGSDTVAVATPATLDGKSIGDGGGAVANDGVPKLFGPFRPDLYNDSDGNVTVTHTQTTGVTCKVFKLP